MSEFPKPEGITLTKMASGSIGMSDNGALAATQLLIERIRELVEETFTAEDLDKMSKEQRDKLVVILKVGCFPHIRCLLAKWAIDEENKFIEPLIPTTDKYLRMEFELNSLIHAIQKNFSAGIFQYCKGQANDFASYMKIVLGEFPLFHTGRAGTGSRMDANFENAYAIAMNYTAYEHYLTHDASIRVVDSTLVDSCLVRLCSVEFYARLIARARWWIKVFAPLRVLCNCHGLEGHRVHNMGAAMDTMEWAALEILDNPGLLRAPDFDPFSENEFPCLGPYKASKREEVKGGQLVIDMEIERIYGREDKVEELVDQIVACQAKGILSGIYHNAYAFLTSCEGKHATEEWNEELKEQMKHCVADNIVLAESFIGRVDRHWRIGLNFDMFVVSGLVTAQHGGLFGGVPSFWNREHTEACISFTRKYHKIFLAKEKDRILNQERAFAATHREKERLAEEKSMRESLLQISYFTIPTLRKITKVKELRDAVKTLPSETQKKDFLKLFISMYRIGFGIEAVSTAWSTKKDPSIGTYTELLDRAEKILLAKYTIPERPPIRKVRKNSTPATYGLTPTESFLECVEVCDEVSNDAISKVLELEDMYAIRLLTGWNSIQRQYWNVPLTDFMKEFRRDRIFFEGGFYWKVIGLSWDTNHGMYAVYFYKLVDGEKPPTHMNDEGKRIEFSFFVPMTIRGKIYPGIHTWEELAWTN